MSEPVQPIVIENKIPEGLLVYCQKPSPFPKEAYSLPNKEKLQTVSQWLADNHGIYALCYEKQKKLVDAVNRNE